MTVLRKKGRQGVAFEAERGPCQELGSRVGRGVPASSDSPAQRAALTLTATTYRNRHP